MPQSLLPLIPDGASRVSDLISVVRENGEWTYFCGVYPVFCHPETDRRSFRMFTAQLVCQGACQQVEHHTSLRRLEEQRETSRQEVQRGRRRWLLLCRKGQGATVLTTEVAAEAQRLLSAGRSRHEVADELAVKYDTLRKAIQQGRLQEPAQPAEPSAASDKSHRSGEDALAEMGTACTRPGERILAALGMLNGAPTRFESCRDVSFGGVLCALPGLIENGLLRHLDQALGTLTGYYTTMHVLLLLGYMALCRIKTAERLQYEPPGELGKLLGLDRVPEVRCLRRKMDELSADDAAEKWAGLLSRDWMEASPELAGTLYVDGHVRLYHGQKTELPRRYVARQRLCLRGTTDYWVNDAIGQPFFVVERPIDQGMLEVLRSDVVPRLLQDVPRQPSQEQLEQDRYLARFILIFDREGYSPAFFKEMWEKHRIACITYHKYPKAAWPETEFVQTEVSLPNGEQVSLKLAERGSWIGNRHDGLWVREIRKLTDSGHQTSLIGTAYSQLAEQNAAGLFSRWSQENFFRYMMEHYAIDLLSEYGTETIAGTNRPVVNPNWRELDRQSRSLKGKLVQRQARFAAMTLHPEPDEKEVSEWEKRKTILVEEIEQLDHELNQVKQRLKGTPKHMAWDELPAEQKFERLASSRKRLTDTVKMIAYRTETAMTTIVREELARKDDARALLRNLFRSEADLLPDTTRGVLEVHIHPMANPRSNRAIAHLLAHLNDASLTYPGTNLKLVYTMPGFSRPDSGPPEIPESQDI